MAAAVGNGSMIRAYVASPRASSINGSPSSAVQGRRLVGPRILGSKHGEDSVAVRMQVASRVAPRASASANASTASGEQLYELPEYEYGELDHPRWAGDSPVSKIVSGLISFKPLFSLLKPMARLVLIRTAEQRGIPWQKMSDDILSAKEVYEEKERLENKNLVYPDYYLKEFHAYGDGNLSWLAASEVEPATLSMMVRAIKTAKSVEEAIDVLRGGWYKTIYNHHVQHSGGAVSSILDIGCATGSSTRYLADKFPTAHVTGLDLSPYFLAVAQYLDKQEAAKEGPRKQPIRWIHGRGESTGLPSASFDIVSIAYVFHECPVAATQDLLAEARRLLKPGGTIAITEIDPKSKIIQNLPPVLFTLMKSTEPWTDEYYKLDLASAMRELGFTNVQSRLTDPRHRTITGTCP